MIKTIIDWMKNATDEDEDNDAGDYNDGDDNAED
jgi:hypothetical protein